MKPRHWITLITLALLALVVVLGWGEIVRAWQLMGRVDLWILALVLPVQIASYYATGEVIFTYLRSKGDLASSSRWWMARVALELNFVNHILPSGGAAGFSYLGWVLGREGVSAGRATMAQIVRFALTFVTYMLILLAAIVVLAFDHEINRTIIGVSAVIVLIVVAALTLVLFGTSNHARMLRFAGWVTRVANALVRFVTFGRKEQTLDLAEVETFFTELHQDYLEIMADKKVLLVPFLWAIVLNLCDIGLLYVAFASLGFHVDPAILVVAFGLSSIVSIFSGTPGGAGAYEAAMIALLASAGVPTAASIAGTLLARVTLLLGTVIFGYVFYQLRVNKFGKAPNPQR